jgi:hypothetical protein
MSSRPRLKSYAHPLRRGPGSLQLGLSPDAGVILDGLSDAEIVMAEGLDGSMDVQTLYSVAADAGVSAGRVASLIATLSEHQLLVDTVTDAVTDRALLSPVNEPARYRLQPDATAIAAAYALSGDGDYHVAARLTKHVVISGEGDLPCALADLLRVGGIGQVSVGANAVNAVDLELRGHPTGSAHPPFSAVADLPARPDLVVLAAMGAIRPDAGEPWLRRGIPHLPLVVQGHRVQIGPLITGGDGPCLSCMDLHRCDRDPAWPAVLSQLAPGWPLLPGAPVSLENTLTTLTAGAAAMIVNTCLDGQPVPGDISLELSLPWPTILSRRWFRHPLCECTAGHATMAG